MDGLYFILLHKFFFVAGILEKGCPGWTFPKQCLALGGRSCIPDSRGEAKYNSSLVVDSLQWFTQKSVRSVI